MKKSTRLFFVIALISFFVSCRSTDGFKDSFNIAKSEPVSDNENAEGKLWSDIYKDFILNKKYTEKEYNSYFLAIPEQYSSNESVSAYYYVDDIFASLYDISSDGVPELFMANSASQEMYYRNHVFTIEDGELVYCGEVGCMHAWPHKDTCGERQGIFVTCGHMGMYICTYCTIKNKKIIEEDVFNTYDEMAFSNISEKPDIYERELVNGTDAVYYEKATDDLDLYRCGKTCEPLPRTSLKNIETIGWNGFLEACGLANQQIFLP
ncbi:MAG: hypothetical protein J5662_00630 [Clostridia bacterium]|nr:hypothetical protein [Clostridia bacterium]